ncbi:MAG: hypothetical protein Q7S30_02075 [Candidatus Omnitrophota bacterium]|nr:hypothetical protein [Candidatus Omnitrophota bacterium]
MHDKKTGMAVLVLLAFLSVSDSVFLHPAGIDARQVLAPSSVFAPSFPIPRSSGSGSAFMSGSELLTIAFDLYASYAINKEPLISLDNLIAKYSAMPRSFISHLAKFDLDNMRADAKGGILYIPYGDGMEIRLYGNSGHDNELPLEKGQRLLERGSSRMYSIEIVSALSKNMKGAAKVLTEGSSWKDSMVRLCTLPATKEYRKNSYRNRRDINEERNNWEVLYEDIFPKLRREKSACESMVKPAILTIGISGTANSGKSTLAEIFQKKLSEEFKNVARILFDDWLLQVSDREIDPKTGKTTEDVFKKFDVDNFVKSMKAFINGQDMLKPIYDQTAKGSLKMTLSEEGALVLLFGPKRKMVVVDTPEGVRLSIQDENGNTLETAPSATVFDLFLEIEDAHNGTSREGFVLKVFNTRIRVGATDEAGRRTIQIIDKKGNNVKNVILPESGELIADSGTILTAKGYIDAGGRLINKPWKVKEHIQHEDGVFIVEGILSLYDYPGQPPGKSLPELYTTSLFADGDFEVRLERGLLREKGRVEALKGRPMSEEEIVEYIALFTERKETQEEPYIYNTRKCAEFTCTNQSRAEGIFSLYRNGNLLSRRFSPVMKRMGLDAGELNGELDRIEQDFILDRLRRSTVRGEILFDRKIESSKYDVYFLKGGMVVKVPKIKRPGDNGLGNCIDLLRPIAGDVMVPCMIVDASVLDIKIEGVSPGYVIVQNAIKPLDILLGGASEEEGRKYLDRFFELQKKMWKTGIIDLTPSFDRYGHMITSKGRPSALLYAIDNVSTDSKDFNSVKLRELKDDLPVNLQKYYQQGIEDTLAFMSKDIFGSGISDSKMLLKFFHPQISSVQIGYLASLITEHKLGALWRLFKTIDIPAGIAPEAVWTRLWLDNMAPYSSEAKRTVEAFYNKLLLNADFIKGVRLHSLRKLIINPPSTLDRKSIFQINEFIDYLHRASLEMVNIGGTEGETRSSLRIKQDFYEEMDPRDKRDLCDILSGPSKLAEIEKASDGRIRTDHAYKISRPVYMTLRKPVPIYGRKIDVIRIEGATPSVKTGTDKVISHAGRGYAGRVMESYPSGAIIVYEYISRALGTMLYSSALREYELMEEFAGSVCDTDTALGLGMYKDLKFNNRSVGYVICGLEGFDYRLCFETGAKSARAAGNMTANDNLGGDPIDIEDKLPEFYEKLGKAMRYFHDNGYSHRNPQLGSVGVRLNQKDGIGVALRGLNMAQHISSGALPERVGDRFIDISEILYDLFRKRVYFEEYGGSRKTKVKMFLPLAKNFLKGYFHEPDDADPEFIKLAEHTADFAKRMAGLAGVKGAGVRDYEELNEETAYFGRLLKRLYMAEERLLPGASHKKGKAPADAAQQALLSEEINKADRKLANAAIDSTGPVCHIIDYPLIPTEQAILITQINKLTRSDDFKEKIIIANKGESIEEAIAKTIKRYPNAVIDAAVSTKEEQDKLAKSDVLALVFHTEEGPCNFRQIEGIVGALRALQRNDKVSLLKIYELLTGSVFGDHAPDDVKELIKILIFKLPAIEIKDPSDLKRLNDNLVELIKAA